MTQELPSDRAESKLRTPRDVTGNDASAIEDGVWGGDRHGFCLDCGLIPELLTGGNEEWKMEDEASRGLARFFVDVRGEGSFAG